MGKNVHQPQIMFNLYIFISTKFNLCSLSNNLSIVSTCERVGLKLNHNKNY